jgi:hypothetical protein
MCKTVILLVLYQNVRYSISEHTDSLGSPETQNLFERIKLSFPQAM